MMGTVVIAVSMILILLLVCGFFSLGVSRMASERDARISELEEKLKEPARGNGKDKNL